MSKKMASQRTVPQTNEDKDDMEDVVGGEENVDHESEGVRKNYNICMYVFLM
jgi:hypothetical protein